MKFDSFYVNLCFSCDEFMYIPNPDNAATCIGLYDCSIDPCINVRIQNIFYLYSQRQ